MTRERCPAGELAILPIGSIAHKAALRVLKIFESGLANRPSEDYSLTSFWAKP
jgi:hypothetical protein